MGTAGVLLPQHALLHTADVTNGPPLIGDRTFAGLTDSQMRLRPGKGLNSLAWLLWHMARTEDVNVNLVVRDGRQVWDDAWARRLNVARMDIGTGMTEDEVGELSAVLDLSVARAYRSAVGRARVKSSRHSTIAYSRRSSSPRTSHARARPARSARGLNGWSHSGRTIRARRGWRRSASRTTPSISAKRRRFAASLVSGSRDDKGTPRAN
jgi:DinB superfamily